MKKKNIPSNQSHGFSHQTLPISLVASPKRSGLRRPAENGTAGSPTRRETCQQWKASTLSIKNAGFYHEKCGLNHQSSGVLHVFTIVLPSKNGDCSLRMSETGIKKSLFSMDYIWLEHHVHHIHGTYRYICWPCQENGTPSSQALNTFAAWCSVAWFAKSLRCVTRNPWEDSEKEQVTFPFSLNFS